MKYFIFILIFSFNSVFAQIFPVETLKFSGDRDKRINLVILSDGYQSTELPQFISDANDFMTALFSESPFSEYADYFNVYAIKVPSVDSGADHPGTSLYPIESTISPIVPVGSVNTYFNATFDSYQQHRLLYYEIDGAAANNTKTKIYSVLASNLPEYDQALILVNSPYYGGSGGEFPMASRASGGNAIAIHEIGHSLFNLKDEYYPGDTQVGEAINMTQQSISNLVKWKNWIGFNGVDVFQYGTSGIASTWYKPRHQQCKMEVLNKPFCSVCKEGIIEKIHSLVSPIDSYSPVNTEVNNPSYPLDFQLDLIIPTTNSLENTWTLNDTFFSNNLTDISVVEMDLVEGTNTIMAVVHDATTLLKVTNHEISHVYAVTWTINKSVLGIDEISSETSRFEISLYPNPANTLVNFKVESNADPNLKIEVISLDGRKIMTIPIYKSEWQQVDISNLSTGIYLTNLYANNTLISSKKLVKQ